MMTRIERIVSAYIGRRLELLRLERGITAEEMGRRIGKDSTAYRLREVGMHPITPDFLLRCHMVLGPEAIDRLWFPVDMRTAAVDDTIIRIQVGLWERRNQPVTYEQIIEVCAEAFNVPAQAVASGSSCPEVRKARTAATLIVASRPHLRLTTFAMMAGRSPRALFLIRKQALRDGGDMLRRVEEIQREVDAL